MLWTTVFMLRADTIMEFDDKPIRLTDVKAIRLAKARALRESRSFANAAAVSIIERLSGAEHSTVTPGSQGKSKGVQYG